jgi:hypothetical protein
LGAVQRRHQAAAGSETMLGSKDFQAYHKTLYRVMFADLVGVHIEANRGRVLSIVGTSEAHELWLAKHRNATAPRARTATDIAA